MHRILLAALLASGAFAGTALAQTAAPPPAPTRLPPPPPGMGPMPGGGRMMLLRADVNGDGVVTREEALTQADLRFARLDANKDGAVSADEMRAAAEAMRARRDGDEADAPVPPPGGPRHAPGMGRAADPNGDGTITLAEARARAGERFDRLDTNHDGKLDKTELARPGRGFGRGRPGPDMPPPPPPPPADDQ